jgi:hypothetical protein
LNISVASRVQDSAAEETMNRFYRVIRQDSPSGRASYVLYQVSYDGQGNIRQVSADAVSPSRDTIDELREDLERMRQALELPVLSAEGVLDSLETSGASAYGRWMREQIMDPSAEADTPLVTTVSHGELVCSEQRRLEALAEIFAEKRRNDPSFG